MRNSNKIKKETNKKGTYVESNVKLMQDMSEIKRIN